VINGRDSLEEIDTERKIKLNLILKIMCGLDKCGSGQVSLVGLFNIVMNVRIHKRLVIF
jgi:hypothetical protein